MAFIGGRETATADQAYGHLEKVNTALINGIRSLTNEAMEKEVTAAFYGKEAAYELLFDLLMHGSRHFGKAWAIIQGLT
jgi:hypothetical protein